MSCTKSGLSDVGALAVVTDVSLSCLFAERCNWITQRLCYLRGSSLLFTASRVRPGADELVSRLLCLGSAQVRLENNGIISAIAYF